jgi:hypothetical protein
MHQKVAATRNEWDNKPWGLPSMANTQIPAEKKAFSFACNSCNANPLLPIQRDRRRARFRPNTKPLSNLDVSKVWAELASKPQRIDYQGAPGCACIKEVRVVKLAEGNRVWEGGLNFERQFGGIRRFELGTTNRK